MVSMSISPTAFLLRLRPWSCWGLGVALFWQWLYVSSLYVISFFVAKRDRMISRREVCIYIVGPNSPWILFALLGLYVSVRLILDGNYEVLGH